MDHIEIGRAHVVGHSMGATGASGFAVKYPARVRTLVLIAGLYEDSTAFARRFAPVIAELGQRRHLTAEDRGALIGVLRNVPPSILPSQTGAVRVPALAVVGTADGNLASTQSLAAVWPALRVLLVRGADHGGVLLRPELLTAIRAQFSER